MTITNKTIIKTRFDDKIARCLQKDFANLSKFKGTKINYVTFTIYHETLIAADLYGSAYGEGLEMKFAGTYHARRNDIEIKYFEERGLENEDQKDR